MSIELVLLEELTLVREGFIRIMSDYPEFRFTRIFNNGAEMVDWLACPKSSSPHIIIMETETSVLCAPKTFERVRKIKPQQRIVLLTHDYSEEKIKYYMANKANGFLSKNAMPETVVETLRRVHAFGVCIDPLLSNIMHRVGLPDSPPLSLATYESGLTAHRIRAMLLMLRGKRTKDMAKELCISEKAIEGVRAKIWEVAGCEPNNYPKLMEFAFRHGLTSF